MYVLSIEGMTCDACKRAISNAISHALPGLAFEVDLPRKQVRVKDLRADRQAVLRNAIRDAGYGILDSRPG